MEQDDQEEYRAMLASQLVPIDEDKPMALPSLGWWWALYCALSWLIVSLIVWGLVWLAR
jgi:hypothetical protein